jgi:hypothetical protein
MVQTPTKPTFDLQALEKQLQKRLYAEPLQLVPLQVRCLLRDQTLTIIIQHPEPNLPYPRRVFASLRQMLEDEQITTQYKVLIYLKVYGEQRPYGFHTLKIKSPDYNYEALMLEFHQHESYNIDEDEDFAFNHPVNMPRNSFDLSSFTSDMLELSTPTHQDHLSDDESFAQSSLELRLEDDVHEDETVFHQESSEFYPDDDENQMNTNQASPKFLGKLVLWGVSGSLLLFFSTLYFLTRPCVMGQCAVLDQAQLYADSSNQILNQNPSGKAIFEAQDQLHQAIALLDDIPQWSMYHQEADQLLNTYQTKAQTLENLISSLKIASQASYHTQNPPYPIEKWQESQQKWREAISGLEKISGDSDLYLLAQAKIVEYQQNLSIINRLLNQEAQASDKLNLAKETIKIAQVRQGTAQSLDNWQLVYATWQTALQRLKEIPPQTTGYTQAQQLINEYNPMIAQVREKKNQELFAANAYNQSLRLAQLAKNAQDINQWSSAVYHWRNALEYIQQVPPNSFQYNQVAPLLNTYNNALAKAENQLRVSIELQQAQEDLTHTCQGISKLCDFTIAQNQIKVKLTSDYIEDIRNTAIKAKAQENTNTQIALIDHIATFEKALQVISTNTGLRLEVYEPNGKMAIAYMPQP